MDALCKCRGDKSIHAEHHAIQKLPRPQKKLNHLKKVDMLVIRVNRSGSLGNSKPCLHCLYMLSEKLPEKGYSLCKVYYSTEFGDINEKKLHALINEDVPHVTKYYQDNPSKLERKIQKKRNI